MQDTYFVCRDCGAVNRAPVNRQSGRCGRCKGELETSGAPQAVSDDELDRMLSQSKVPVLIDFWATWCPPCRMIAPVLDELAREHAGRLVVAKVDTDKHQRHMMAHGVRGIPTLVLYAKGAKVNQVTGAVPKPHLQALIDSVL